MDRRDFIRIAGTAAAGGFAATAGCLGLFGSGSGSQAPPRRSKVLRNVELDGGALTVDPYPETKQWVMSRRNIDLQDASIAQDIGSLSPVGEARAAKGRGARGRGSGGFAAAPTTAHGRHRRAWYGAKKDDDDDWYEENEGQVRKLPVAIGVLGIAYLGSNQQFQEQAPGPGPVDWNETYQSVSETIQYNLRNGLGWYRVGAEVAVDESALAGGSIDLGWECLDVRVSNSEITERWKVSPTV